MKHLKSRLLWILFLFTTLLRAAPGDLDSLDALISGTSSVGSAVPQVDGKIILAGTFTTVGGQPRANLARIIPGGTGTLDTLFAPNPDGQVKAVAIQPDGKILIGGAFTHVGGIVRNRIARLNSNGSLDPNFNPSANGDVKWVFPMLPNHHLVPSGNSLRPNGQGGSSDQRPVITLPPTP